MQLVIARKLRRFGHLVGCRAVPGGAGRPAWRLEFKTTAAGSGEVSVLEAQRGHVREFRTLDAAFHAAENIGFTHITVCRHPTPDWL